MQEQGIVTVYAFRVYGSHVESPRLAGFKATKETIQRMQGELVKGTDEEVAATELDAQGRFRRIATGWGELS